MQINEVDQGTLRRLAAARRQGGKVLSVYVDLDPSEFATPAARSTEIRSLIDEAHRRVKQAEEGLSHDERSELRDDVQRVQAFLEGDDFSAKGAHALAVFAGNGGELFEALRLPRSVPSQVALNDAPLIEPMAELATPGRWAVLLLNRRASRLFRGSGDRLVEVEGFASDGGGRDEGSGTQSRGQGAVDEEAHAHMLATVEALRAEGRRRPVDRLLIGSPRDLAPQLERALPTELRERLAGHVDLDVERSGAQDVLRAAGPLIEDDERARERAALDALQEGVGRGARGAAGLDEVLSTLNERRVETLLIDEGFAAPGVSCQRCGWLGASGERCPADGGELEHHEDVVEPAIERTVEQSAQVLVVRHHPDLAARGSIGAVLRF